MYIHIYIYPWNKSCLFWRTLVHSRSPLYDCGFHLAWIQPICPSFWAKEVNINYIYIYTYYSHCLKCVLFKSYIIHHTYSYTCKYKLFDTTCFFLAYVFSSFLLLFSRVLFFQFVSSHVFRGCMGRQQLDRHQVQKEKVGCARLEKPEKHRPKALTFGVPAVSFREMEVCLSWK